MQMSRFLYEPVSRKKRAEAMRRDAADNHRAGFQVFAETLWAEAVLLDPRPPPTEETDTGTRTQSKQRQMTRKAKDNSGGEYGVVTRVRTRHHSGSSREGVQTRESSGVQGRSHAVHSGARVSHGLVANRSRRDTSTGAGVPR